MFRSTRRPCCRMRGFTTFEPLLVLGLIAAIAIAIVVTLPKVRVDAKVHQTVDALQAFAHNVDQSKERPTTTVAAQKDHPLPSDWTGDLPVHNAWGGRIDVTPLPNHQVHVVLHGVPDVECARLSAQNIPGWSSAHIDEQARPLTVQGEPDVDKVLALCDTGSNVHALSWVHASPVTP